MADECLGVEWLTDLQNLIVAAGKVSFHLKYQYAEGKKNCWVWMIHSVKAASTRQ